MISKKSFNFEFNFELLEIPFIQIYSKLHSKPYDFLCKNSKTIDLWMNPVLGDQGHQEGGEGKGREIGEKDLPSFPSPLLPLPDALVESPGILFQAKQNSHIS